MVIRIPGQGDRRAQLTHAYSSQPGSSLPVFFLVAGAGGSLIADLSRFPGGSPVVMTAGGATASSTGAAGAEAANHSVVSATIDTVRCPRVQISRFAA